MRLLQTQIRVLHKAPGLGTLACGWQRADGLISSIGRRWVDESGAIIEASKELPAGPDVFVATTLYPVGGHTALIGDFVRALAEINPAAPSPRLVVTNSIVEHVGPLAPETVARTAIDPDKIDILPGPELEDRLDQLLERLVQWRPQRLFLFHHPEDPVPCAVAQPEIGAQIFLVHHADSIPSFGLYLSEIKIIDVTPSAAATSRAQGFDAALLLLTVPDPGPRTVGFRQRTNLITATCGTFHKFRIDPPHSYPEAVAVILRATRGWHVHIGPLHDYQLSAIYDVLAATNVDRARFIHVPWADSLAVALWEHTCDLYFASFPVGGARSDIEVFASATPHLCYTSRPKGTVAPDKLRPEGGLVWRSLEELKVELENVADARLLEEKSKLMRSAYDRLHHPRAFAAQLKGILEGSNGVEDPHQDKREHRATQRMIDAIGVHTGLPCPEFSMAQFQELVDRVAVS